MPSKSQKDLKAPWSSNSAVFTLHAYEKWHGSSDGVEDSADITCWLLERGFRR